MRVLSFLLIANILNFLFIQICYSLSESEYLHMLQNCSVFRQENTQLTDQWLSMKKTMKGDAWHKVVEEQRKWLSEGRDIDAKKYMSQGYSKDYAYSAATHDRVAVLCAEEDNYKLTPEEKARGDYATPENYGDIAAIPYGTYDGKNMGKISKLIPTSGDLSQVVVVDSFGKNHIYYISRSDIEKKSEKFMNDTNHVECANPVPYEINRPYIFDILKQEPTPEAAKELGDNSPMITIIGNFGQCYD